MKKEILEYIKQLTFILPAEDNSLKAKVAGKRRNTGEKVTSGVLRPSLSSGNTQSVDKRSGG